MFEELKDKIGAANDAIQAAIEEACAQDVTTPGLFAIENVARILVAKINHVSFVASFSESLVKLEGTETSTPAV